jgi:hypothetical protein
MEQNLLGVFSHHLTVEEVSSHYPTDNERKCRISGWAK